MGDVRNISADVVTPVDVVRDLEKNLSDLKAVYVVGFDHDGRPSIWASGNLQLMAMAAVALHAKTVDVLHEGGL